MKQIYDIESHKCKNMEKKMSTTSPTLGRRRSGSVESSYIPPSTLDQALQRVVGDSRYSQSPLHLNRQNPFSRYTSMEFQPPSHPLSRNPCPQDAVYGTSPPVRHVSGNLPRLPSIGERLHSTVHAHGAFHLFPV